MSWSLVLPPAFRQLFCCPTRGVSAFSLVLIGLLFLVSLMVILVPSLLFTPLLFLLRRFSSIHDKLQEVFRLWKESRFRNFASSLTLTSLAFLMLAAIPVLFSHGTAYPISYQSGIGAISISNILSWVLNHSRIWYTGTGFYRSLETLWTIPKRLHCPFPQPISWLLILGHC